MMCECFAKADPIQYEQRSRSVRVHGMLTSIRLENMVWDTLAEMAEDKGCTVNALIAQFHDEILAHRGEVPNFASFLRVTCIRYLRRRMHALEKQQPAARDALLAPLQTASSAGAALPHPTLNRAPESGNRADPHPLRRLVSNDPRCVSPPSSCPAWSPSPAWPPRRLNDS